ncbi:MAG: bifunctional cobalt-precorrin-7 (C(5))-methyltransferase CbiE/decarboxylating cobalt-precorrin-6B (C(15))-methyltransferase CbiT [Ferrimicrobium sp.]
MITLIGWIGDDPDNLTGHQRDAIEGASWILASAERIPPLHSLNPLAHIESFSNIFMYSLAKATARTEDLVIVASGDPNFFGVASTLRRLHPQRKVTIMPGPSSVTVACARLGVATDRLVTVSLVARDPTSTAHAVADALAAHLNVAVLVPSNTGLDALEPTLRDPELTVTALANLGTASETITELNSAEYGGWRSTNQAVVIIENMQRAHSTPAVATPHPPILDLLQRDDLATDGGNYTKAPIRIAIAVRLGLTTLPMHARVLEVGAGSGGVGLALWLLRPDLNIIQLEPNQNRARLACTNATVLGASSECRAIAIEALPETERFDAAIVGGGGIPALRTTLAHLDPNAPVVASFADPRRAADALELLGNLELIQHSRAVSFGNDNYRLDPETPIYLAWR